MQVARAAGRSASWKGNAVTSADLHELLIRSVVDYAIYMLDPQGRIVQSGNLLALAKIARDMTEQHNTQLAMQESERRFRLLVQSVTDYAIFMLDPQGQVKNWNAGAARIKGYDEAEILGEHFSRFY